VFQRINQTAEAAAHRRKFVGAGAILEILARAERFGINRFAQTAASVRQFERSIFFAGD